MPSSSTHFRPCIDLHHGLVKQIVGKTLTTNDQHPQTNFTSNQPASHFASLYKNAHLKGGHLIMLGPGNYEAACQALAAWPQGLQVGGGINEDNALDWLKHGASKIIITSWLFPNGQFDLNKLKRLSNLIGKSQLVMDLSCKRQPSSNASVTGFSWVIAMDKWTRLTNLEISIETLQMLSEYCSEFLVHAADVEGLCQGIDQELVQFLGQHSPIPCTYAGGGTSVQDLALVQKLSLGRVDLTIGSALDIFGGTGVTLAECIDWNKAHPRSI